MAFLYEGVDVDKPTAGFTGAPVEATRANNIIVIANERIGYYNSIAASYKKAYDALAAFKTANPNQRATNYDFTTLGKLQLELDKWNAIVVRNGGTFKSAGSAGGFIGDDGKAEANFTAKIAKYNQDINKNKLIVDKFKATQPTICIFPTPSQVMDSIVKDAREANAVAVANAQAQATRENDFYNGVKNFNDPNRNATGDANWNPAGEAANVLNTGQAAGVLNWNITTLSIAAATVPGGNLLQPSDLAKVLKQIAPKATLATVKNILASAIKDVKARSIPKPAPNKNASLKPASSVIASTNPTRPKTVAPISNNVKNLTNPPRR